MTPAVIGVLVTARYSPSSRDFLGLVPPRRLGGSYCKYSIRAPVLYISIGSALYDKFCSCGNAGRLLTSLAQCRLGNPKEHQLLSELSGVGIRCVYVDSSLKCSF